jgi:hypothetical protein
MNEAVQCCTLVKKAVYLANTGMTDGEFRGKCQRGKFTKGVHYFIQDRATWVDVEAIEEWIRSGGSALKTVVSKSVTAHEARCTRRSSINRGTGPTVLKPVE